MDYAEVVNRLNDEIASVIARAQRAGMTKREIIDELSRIADELENE